MRRGMFGFFVFCILGASPLAAQSIPREGIQGEKPTSVPAAPTPTTASPDYAVAPAETMEDNCCCRPLRFWANGEYLLWWIRNAPNPVPLVTTGDPATSGNAGKIGDPTTRVLFGGSDLDYRAFSGGRLTTGLWLDPNRLFGLEASAFLLERRSAGFSASSDDVGKPALGIPFQNSKGKEAVFIVSGFGFATGGLAASSSSQLWGAEATGLMNLLRTPRWKLDFLLGFRYLNLDEDFSFAALSNTGPILRVTATDQFDTQNQFYGGQLGARLGYRINRVSLDFESKVALGSTHQVVNINGFSTIQGFPGGPARFSLWHLRPGLEHRP